MAAPGLQCAAACFKNPFLGRLRLLRMWEVGGQSPCGEGLSATALIACRCQRMTGKGFHSALAMRKTNLPGKGEACLQLEKPELLRVIYVRLFN